MDITRKLETINNEKDTTKFVYYYNDNLVIDKEILERVEKLRIPPNWNNVLISNSPSSYLQATGIDSKGRKQYIYHPLWNTLSRIDKYSKLKEFSRKIPLLKKHINKELKGSIRLNDKNYLMSLIVLILLKTHSRIGNDVFVEENNTYGLTTLLKKHVTIKNNDITITYTGKKSIVHTYKFRCSIISSVLSELKKLPGSRLFKTVGGEYVTSNDINVFIKTIMGESFTAKDFRTYAANILFIKYLKEMSTTGTKQKHKKNVIEAYDKVAKDLGHTRTICRNSYVMSSIVERYMEDVEKFSKLSFEDFVL